MSADRAMGAPFHPPPAASRRQPSRHLRPPLHRCPMLPLCRAGEEARGLSAYEREYEDDHSWEELEEDEFGNLRALVRSPPADGDSDLACAVCCSLAAAVLLCVDRRTHQLVGSFFHLLRPPLLLQDRSEEQRARRRRLLSAAASARIRRGMIRYVQVVLDLSRAASLSG